MSPVSGSAHGWSSRVQPGRSTPSHKGPHDIRGVAAEQAHWSSLASTLQAGCAAGTQAWVCQHPPTTHAFQTRNHGRPQPPCPSRLHSQAGPGDPRLPRLASPPLGHPQTWARAGSRGTQLSPHWVLSRPQERHAGAYQKLPTPSQSRRPQSWTSFSLTALSTPQPPRACTPSSTRMTGAGVRRHAAWLPWPALHERPLRPCNSQQTAGLTPCCRSSGWQGARQHQAVSPQQSEAQQAQGAAPADSTATAPTHPSCATAAAATYLLSPLSRRPAGTSPSLPAEWALRPLRRPARLGVLH